MARVQIKLGPYSTQEEAERIRKLVYQNYHPVGYGTSLKILANNPDPQKATEFWVKGYRYDSCD